MSGDFERVRARTVRVLTCVPEHRMEWRPAEEGFSFGDLARHLGAVERWMFAARSIIGDRST